MPTAKIGLIGLGVMGQNLALNIERNGFSIAVFERELPVLDAFIARESGKQIFGAHSPDEFVRSIERPRKIILLVKAGDPVDWTINLIKPTLEPGDIIIDGGNSNFRDTERREKELLSSGMFMIGSGTSGGEKGALWGPSLMPGGDPQAYEKIRPIWEAIAAKVPDGPCVTYIGPGGSGHFVKMVHNGIEYGLMAAYAEGMNILKHANVGKSTGRSDAETAPLRDPEHYQYDFNLADVSEVWRRGSVVASWLLDLTASAMLNDPQLAGFSGRVSDSGEGRWTILAAVEEGAPAPVLSAALYERFASRGESDFANKLLSAMRFEFGGHLEKKA
jgi:6-phosphogluconate dehydrogenase